MGNVMAYSGITTKVRAMSAKLLAAEDYDTIAGLGTVTEAIEYLKDKRLWQVELFNQTKLCLKKNTTAGDIIGYSDAFVQISQSAIININYLAMIKSKQCLLYPPFSDKEDLIISRGFLKELQERFCII